MNKPNSRHFGFDIKRGDHVWIGPKEDRFSRIGIVTKLTNVQFVVNTGTSERRYWKNGQPVSGAGSVRSIASDGEVAEYQERRRIEKHNRELMEKAQQCHKQKLSDLEKSFEKSNVRVSNDEYDSGKLSVTFHSLDENDVVVLASIIKKFINA